MPFDRRASGRLCLLAALALTPLGSPAAVAESEKPAEAASSAVPASAAEAPPSPAASEAKSPEIKSPEIKSPEIKSPEIQPLEVKSPETAQPAAAAAPAVSAFIVDVASALDRLPSTSAVDKRDRAGLLAAYDARKGAPIWMTPQGARAQALQLAAGISSAADWGLDAAAFAVPELEPARADGPDLAPDRLADAEVRLSLAVLKYARHARGGRVEPTELTKYLDRKAPVFDPASVLEQIALASDPAGYLQSLHPRHPEFERLRQRYLAVRAESVPSNGISEAQRLLANMEQWRWMPDNLGRFHVTVNVPEQIIRVVRDGRVIHSERVVVGKIDTQTPIFSDEMEQVIFHPFWGVPDSIKQLEVLPSLQGNGKVFAKYNLRIQSGGRDVDPSSVDWRKTDIRKFHVYQPPGDSNVLGVVKFRFPNKHDVYMHDTPSKSLFKSAVRTFSHGCMRVQNPVRLAELVLAEDKRMASDAVQALTLKGAPENNQINLSRRIPVHITYFTASLDEAGKVSTFKDIYGHEERILLGLDGKLHLIKPVPEPKGPPEEPLTRVAQASKAPSPATSPSGGFIATPTSRSTDWVRRAFTTEGN